jgi:Mg2+ and Co2+ transporter CorA
VLLVPTLVAGVYGANTDFPGVGTAWGTTAMFVLMALGGAVVFFGLRWARLSEEKRIEEAGAEASATPQ